MALEILGAVAAGVALCTTLVESGKAIRKATKRIRNARKDVLELSDEAVIFAGLCEDFLHTCNDHREAKSRVFGSLHRLVAWLDHFKNALSELLNKVKAIIRDPRYHYSWEKKCIAYLEWMGSKNTVKKLRASLELAMSSISGYSNLMYIQRLHEELQMLKLALENERSRQTIEEKFGMTLEEKIEMVLQSIDNKSSVQDTNKRRLRAAKDKTVRLLKGKKTADLAYVPDDLMHFTESLRGYAKEVLSPIRSSRRSHSNRSSTSVAGTGFVQTPLRWRSQDPGSISPSNQAHISRQANLRPGLATSSSVSTSANSRSSSVQIIPRPKTISSVSSASHETVESKLGNGRENEQTHLRHGAPSFFEIRDMKSREYINDPEGNILSRPKVRNLTLEPHAPKTQQMGRHKMILSATDFRINNHSYVVKKYHVAAALFETLLQHPDKFDKLVEVLDAGEEEEKWDGIPGWVADSRRILRQPENIGIEDVQSNDTIR